MKQHHYKVAIQWTGNRGEGTKSYQSYDRSHTVEVSGKPRIECSSDPAFRGDPLKYNPEELFLSSLSGCHMLWYLHLCSEAQVIVVNYTDHANGLMVEENNGSGRFTRVTLHPVVTVQDAAMIEKAIALHAEANKLCFIANSCNFPVEHMPECYVA
ncbi:OsmC family protein [Dyadobacter sandarakinus]|uniref:OsmC family protein n=1 Tax=Dyadobacter sandarakinus TaxID=2747268 RepID=A0ABX7I3E6_9BACT|nr:OsmC family protein [Dyadobacter sandarakinus]QRR00042.1 OsmC family protein [Dyadobacter sandarakinus]